MPCLPALPARCSPSPPAALGQIGIFALPLPSISDASMPSSSLFHAAPLVGSPPTAAIQPSSSSHPLSSSLLFTRPPVYLFATRNLGVGISIPVPPSGSSHPANCHCLNVCDPPWPAEG